jgi:hypothetical protein
MLSKLFKPLPNLLCSKNKKLNCTQTFQSKHQVLQQFGKVLTQISPIRIDNDAGTSSAGNGNCQC